MSVIGILFWLWFAVSVVLLIQRRLRRRAAARTAEPTVAVVDPAPGGPVPVEDGQAASAPSSAAGSATDPARPAPAEPAAPPADRSAPAARPAGDGRPGLADALNGIRLPCDLVPLTIGVTDLDPAHVDLVTSGVGPQRVAEELGRELDRLGYEVSDLGAGEYLASRDGTVVRLKIHDRPAVSIGGDGRGFPTAPPDGIVVELTLS
jgi:hypothetical protein